MAKSKPTAEPPPPPPTEGGGEYTVVARRYRPQQFADLIGQEHVAKALVNALQSGRVAHAYLFTGARGVGKTSRRPHPGQGPQLRRGADRHPVRPVRQLPRHRRRRRRGRAGDRRRQQQQGRRGPRPAAERRLPPHPRPVQDLHHRRSPHAHHVGVQRAAEDAGGAAAARQVHLRHHGSAEDPDHDPVAGASGSTSPTSARPASSTSSSSIVEREGLQADDDALRLVARRAAGSMRDSQSLLDQLLASCTGRLTAEQRARGARHRRGRAGRGPRHGRPGRTTPRRPSNLVARGRRTRASSSANWPTS